MTTARWPSASGAKNVIKGPLLDATCQISKLKTFQFQRKRILKKGFFNPKFQLVNAPCAWANFDPPRASYEQTW